MGDVGEELPGESWNKIMTANFKKVRQGAPLRHVIRNYYSRYFSIGFYREAIGFQVLPNFSAKFQDWQILFAFMYLML